MATREEKKADMRATMTPNMIVLEDDEVGHDKDLVVEFVMLVNVDELVWHSGRSLVGNK
jgi:hypothetical protein